MSPLPYGWSRVIATIGAEASLTMPAVPGASWIVDTAELCAFAASPAGQFYDGNLNIYNGPTNASQLLASTIWHYYVVSLTTGYSDTVVIDGPIIGDPGAAMLITSALANGFVANSYYRLKAKGQLI